MSEEEAYKTALDELQNKRCSEGIWSKAIAFSEGDEKKAEANYLRFRAEQLQKNERCQKVSKAKVSVVLLTTTLAPILFSPKGKVTRTVFILIILSSAATIALSISLIESLSYKTQETFGFLSFPILLGAAWSLICAHLKRARDVGASNIFAFFLVLFYILLPISLYAGPNLTLIQAIMFVGFLIAPSR